MKQIGYISHRLASIATMGVIAVAGDAQAQTISTVTGNIGTSIKTTPGLMSSVAYLAGLTLGLTGLFKLRGHVDAPQNVPLKDGVIRLGVGGGLLALPYVASTMKTTINAGTSGSIAPPAAGEIGDAY